MTKILSRRLWLSVTALIGTFVSVIVAAYFFTGITPKMLMDQGSIRRSAELIRYTMLRLQGHDKLEFLLLPALHMAQRYYERPTDGQPLPTLGKGQQLKIAKTFQPAADVVVYTVEDFQLALKNAKPGQIIELAQGTYRLNQSIRIGGHGSIASPITVRAGKIGSAIIEFNTTEGFLVDQPNWVFQDLTVRGVCKADDDCEHAFHIVGKAENITLRNNLIEDFNAHIKVNGYNGDWPDHGILLFNTLTNTHTRSTTRSVTPFDLVGASYWKVSDNLISNFVKGDGNKVSFGMFMKGASQGGRFERNLVICSPNDISGPGVRVGISFGGGGTNPTGLCREDNCKYFEHSNGLAANNIIIHCNDSGLDVNHSTKITLAHNTLINTSGIDVRINPAEAQLYGNLYEGNVRARDGTIAVLKMDQPMRATAVFEDADHLQLNWRNIPENILSLRGLSEDFCGQPRSDGTPPGALNNLQGCSFEHLQK